jgi:hypothetical protein
LLPGFLDLLLEAKKAIMVSSSFFATTTWKPRLNLRLVGWLGGLLAFGLQLILIASATPPTALFGCW